MLNDGYPRGNRPHGQKAAQGYARRVKVGDDGPPKENGLTSSRPMRIDPHPNPPRREVAPDVQAELRKYPSSLRSDVRAAERRK